MPFVIHTWGGAGGKGSVHSKRVSFKVSASFNSKLLRVLKNCTQYSVLVSGL